MHATYTTHVHTHALKLVPIYFLGSMFTLLIILHIDTRQRNPPKRTKTKTKSSLLTDNVGVSETKIFTAHVLVCEPCLEAFIAVYHAVVHCTHECMYGR